MRSRNLLLLCLLLASMVACAPAPAPTPTATPNPLAGGVLATFDVHGEEFRIWITNEETIQQILDLQQGKSQATIPNGRIQRGPGQGDHNAPWSWHLDPDDIHMAEVTIELCDGTPSFVESELEYFLDTVKRYCAWSSRLVQVQDYR